MLAQSNLEKSPELKFSKIFAKFSRPKCVFKKKLKNKIILRLRKEFSKKKVGLNIELAL